MKTLGKYGIKIKRNLEENYPFRFQELVMDGIIMDKLLEREQEIMRKRDLIEQNLRKKYKRPQTNEFLALAKYNQEIAEMTEEFLQEEIEEKI